MLDKNTESRVHVEAIEEPPPHLVFVFCTTDLAKVIPTVRSRCQTFVFQRPRMQELVQTLRKICDGEEIDATVTIEISQRDIATVERNSGWHTQIGRAHV